MNIYALYVNPEQDITFIPVKGGFSFTAALFAPVWALYNKMWSILFLSLIVNIILLLVKGYYPQGVSIFELAIILFFGFFASDLREYDLQKKGYKLKDILIAPSEIEVEIKFLTKVEV